MTNGRLVATEEKKVEMRAAMEAMHSRLEQLEKAMREAEAQEMSVQEKAGLLANLFPDPEK